jgi:hypothetical protein
MAIDPRHRTGNHGWPVSDLCEHRGALASAPE